MKWYGWTIIALVVALVFFWRRDRANMAQVAELLSAQDSTHFEDLRQVMVLKAQSDDRLMAKIRLLQYKNLSDSTLWAVKDRSSTTKIRRLQGIILSVPVVMAAGSDSLTRAQLYARDTALVICLDQVTNLKEAEALEDARQDSIHHIRNQIDSVKEVAITALNAAAWDNAARVENLEKKLDNPWSFGFYGGYGATMAGGQVYVGPQVGGGLQYKIRIRRKR